MMNGIPTRKTLVKFQDLTLTLFSRTKTMDEPTKRKINKLAFPLRLRLYEWMKGKQDWLGEHCRSFKQVAKLATTELDFEITPWTAKAIGDELGLRFRPVWAEPAKKAVGTQTKLRYHIYTIAKELAEVKKALGLPVSPELEALTKWTEGAETKE